MPPYRTPSQFRIKLQFFGRFTAATGRNARFCRVWLIRGDRHHVCFWERVTCPDRSDNPDGLKDLRREGIKPSGGRLGIAIGIGAKQVLSSGGIGMSIRHRAIPTQLDLGYAAWEGRAGERSMVLSSTNNWAILAGSLITGVAMLIGCYFQGQGAHGSSNGVGTEIAQASSSPERMRPGRIPRRPRPRSTPGDASGSSNPEVEKTIAPAPTPVSGSPPIRGCSARDITLRRCDEPARRGR